MLPFLMSLLFMNPAPPEVLTIPENEWSKQEMVDLATDIAEVRGLDVDLFLAVINCESRWDRFAVGDHGLSHGLAQLYYPTRDWGIATTTAYDPIEALSIMGNAWVAGDAWRWTCFRVLSDA